MQSYNEAGIAVSWNPVQASAPFRPNQRQTQAALQLSNQWRQLCSTEAIPRRLSDSLERIERFLPDSRFGLERMHALWVLGDFYLFRSKKAC